MKVIIIGGVAGGATAAARLRRLDEKAEIVIIERSGYVSYANCGLPYYIGGVISDKHELTLQTPESFKQRFNIDVRVNSEAVSIDTASRNVTVKRLNDGSEYTETYDKLILSPGATAVRPPVPGADSKKIMTLRTVEDTMRIRNFIEKAHPKKAVVIGGGFIGLEGAENLIGAGISTTLIQRSAQILPPLDYDMACQLHMYLRREGLDLRLNTQVERYEDAGDGMHVHLKGGKQDESDIIDADIVLMAVGVAPETHLAEDAGLELGIKKSIIVDENMLTSDPDIYAVGDAVMVRHFVSGADSLIALAGPANKQGRIAADNICGISSSYKGSQGSNIIKLFGLTAASTGINEKTAVKEGIRYDRVVISSPSHASYYPGAVPMSIKTLFDPDSGRILGAQIIGSAGADKRIDVIASAIRAGMTAEDLKELDLAYAPPYSSAKDPVNMTGYVIENVRSGLMKQFHWDDIDGLPKDGSVAFIDVRTTAEYKGGCLPGAVNIPLDELRENLDKIDRSKPLYVNCQSGLRSYLACRILMQEGFDCYNLSGGYGFYSHVLADRCWSEDPIRACGMKA